MKCRSQCGKLEVEVEGEDIKDVFDQLSQVFEVLSEDKCGACGSENIAPRVRRVSKDRKEYTYREWVCRNCRATLSFGQKEDGSIFPKRRIGEDGRPCKTGEKGKYVNNGWVKFNGSGRDDEEESPLDEPQPTRTVTNTPSRTPARR